VTYFLTRRFGALEALRYVNETALRKGLSEEQRGDFLVKMVDYDIVDFTKMDNHGFFHTKVEPNEAVYNFLRLAKRDRKKLLALAGKRKYGAAKTTLEERTALFNDVAGYEDAQVRQAFLALRWSEPRLAWEDFKLLAGETEAEHEAFKVFAPDLVATAKATAKKERRRNKTRTQPVDVLHNMAADYHRMRQEGQLHADALDKAINAQKKKFED